MVAFKTTALGMHHQELRQEVSEIVTGICHSMEMDFTPSDILQIQTSSTRSLKVATSPDITAEMVKQKTSPR